jgi:sarcosine oxidase subunit beta
MNESFDYVVIGAGVMGASIAFHLAERRAGTIAVVERAAVASGASGRSSALVRMHYTVREEVQLAVKSLEYFVCWRERLGRPGHFRKTGFVRIVPEREIENLRANVEMQRACGAGVELLTRDELQAIEPRWKLDDVALAAYEPDSGYGDGATVAADFLDRARELGVSYRPRDQVLGVEIERGSLRGVRTAAGLLESRRIVVAAGAWSERLFRAAGIELPLDTEFHEVAILERPPELRDPHVACIDSILDIYFRSEGKSQTLVGDFYGRRGVDPDSFPERPSLEALASKVEILSRRIPSMENAGIARGVGGVYTMTPDCHGLMGEVPGVTGLYCCTGFSGMGFKISPAVGLVMSEILLDGRSKTVDVSAFRPGRFREGAPIVAPHPYADD